MKYLFVAAIAAALASCGTKVQVQHLNYTTTEQNGDKILNGYINRSIVQNDSAFKWFSNNLKWEPNAKAVEVFSKNKNKFTMVVFGGTWCDDTKTLWPQFYSLVDKSSYPEKRITLIGMTREKTTIDDLHKKWNITNVPTFIVLHKGKEIGRVVEYGKYGQVDRELGEIVATIK